jgi:hypothetical protein
MPIRFDDVLFEEKRDAALTGSALRYQSPFAMEPWNVDPVDMMTVEEFISFLIGKFGAEYLEPVPFVRQADGSLAAILSPQ